MKRVHQLARSSHFGLSSVREAKRRELPEVDATDQHVDRLVLVFGLMPWLSATPRPHGAGSDLPRRWRCDQLPGPRPTHRVSR